MELLLYKMIRVFDKTSASPVERQEMVYNFITQNRLAACFYNAGSVNTEINNKLRLEVTTAKMRIDKQIGELIKINTNSGSTVLPLKGFVPYLLTNNEKLLKLSGDLDIISQDNELTNGYLSHNGYICTGQSPSVHEYNILVNEVGMIVEILKYFPVFSVNRVKNKLELLELTYADIYEHSVKANYKDRTITLPGFEVSALISCSHAFKDFAWEPYYLPNFRLMDIVEAYYLSKHQKFDMDIFKHLIEQYNAYDAVSFCCSLIDIFFDQNPLKDLNLHFPRMFKIMNATHGQWVKSNDKDFFYHLPTRRFRDILQDLGVNKIKYAEWHKSSNMENAHINYTTVQPESFEFEVRRNKSTFALNMRISKPFSANDNFFFHTGIVFGHLWIDMENRFYSNGDVKYEIYEDGKSSTVKFCFNLQATGGVLDFVTAVGNRTGDIVTQILIPLSVSEKL